MKCKIKLSEYKLLKEYCSQIWYYNNFVLNWNTISKKNYLSYVYKTLNFKLYLIAYYFNNIKKEISRIIRADKIL